MVDRQLEWFGEPDASQVDSIEDLNHLHITQQRVESGLKYGNKPQGFNAVVGVKGSGKTDLRMNIEGFESAHILNLDTNHAYMNLNAYAIREDPGRVQNFVSMILLREFADRLGRGDSIAKQKLRTAFDRSTEVLKKLPGAIEIGGEALGFQLSVGELLQKAPPEVVQNVVDNLINDVVKALTTARRRGYILIDDMEVVFNGIERNPIFLEGVLLSLADINKACGNRLHALCFVKHGLWRAAFDVQKEYDRVKKNIAFLTWDEDSLIHLIARRIASRRKIVEPLTIEEIWSIEFALNGNFRAFAHELTSYCVNGPRDIIDLCNKAGAEAGDSGTRITIDHVHDCLRLYSKEKLAGLNADYGQLYPGIVFFVRRVFQDLSKPTLSGAELARRINQNVLTSKDARTDTRIGEDLRAGTKEELAGLMYEIGVVGLGTEPHATYAIGSPQIGQSDVMSQDNLVIHPAFRPELRIPLGHE